MHHQSKKSREEDILKTVYSLNEGVDASESERPDFLMSVNGQPPFGVEITELYPSESDARVARIPNYIDDLLSGGRYRHKDDKALPQTVKVTDLEGNVKEEAMPCLIQKIPTVAESAEMLVGTIEGKIERLKSVFGSLSHINLIIYDHTPTLAQVKRADFYIAYGFSSLPSVVLNAPFNEIFLVTEFLEGWHYVCLKQFFFVAELYLYSRAVNATPSLLKSHDDGTSLRGFARYFASLTPHPVHMGHADGAEVYFGNTSLLLHDGKLTLRSHADFPLPEGLQRVTRSPSKRVISAMRRLKMTNIFTSPMNYPIKTAPVY